MRPHFNDRIHAGRRLASALSAYAGRPDTLVLALPRGGVPVAFEVARALDAPLDVFIVRKLGVPGHEEFAMGAIASGGARLVDDAIVRQLRITDEEIDTVTRTEMRELERRERQYRGDRPLPDIAGRTVIIVDDRRGSPRLARARASRARVRAVAASLGSRGIGSSSGYAARHRMMGCGVSWRAGPT